MIFAPQQTTGSDPAGAGLQPAGDGLMWLDGRFHAQLQAAGLCQFEAVMHLADGQCLRVLKERENWYLQLQASRTASQGAYLKKHHIRTWLTRLRATLSIGPGLTAARVEAQNARDLSALGIDVMHVVAYGEKLHADGKLESFLLTEELTGYVDLQTFLRQRFPPRTEGGVGADSREAARAGRDPDLQRLLEQVAEIARRFHGAGYNHRDFYCCHWLVKESPLGQFDIRLIDLQRVQRRRWRRWRWIVKDLAQMAYSAPRDRIGCREKITLLRHYLGVRKLRGRDKRLVRDVLRKVRIMERRLGVAP